MKISYWSIGTRTPEPVPEFKAEGDIQRVYHEIRQSLQVTGVNLNFRTWAAFDKFLPALWDELRPNVETTLFADAARQIREQALQAAESFPPSESAANPPLGESRSYQIRAALELYDAINPKLLVLTSAVLQALQGERMPGPAGAEPAKVPRGEPAKMYAMEMEEEKSEEKAVRRLFKDIRKTLSLPRINSDYRTLALWPDYLARAWSRLKPLCQGPEFQRAADELRERSRALARTLPFRISLTVGRVKELGEDAEQVMETTHSFEQLLPALVLNIALLQLDWKPAGGTQATVTAQPSAAKEGEPVWRSFQRRQRIMELGDRFVSYIDEGRGEPVVLLHGMPTWGFLWERSIAALNLRYRILAPDFLGFGYSEKRDCFDRSIARQAEMIDGFLEKLGVQSAHLVGHDIGGGVALRLATLVPRRVRSLCLLNSVCYDSWPVEAMMQWANPGTLRQLAAAKSLKALRESLATGFNFAPDPAWLDGLLSPWRTEVGKISLIRNASALNTNHTVEISRLLPAITVPTLVLWGEDDPFQPVSYGERLAGDIPGASLARIAGARHFVMMDQPERVHRMIRDFLDQQIAQPQQAAA
jgi:pimeloyl-ACP methyl ester carboxylesterase